VNELLIADIKKILASGKYQKTVTLSTPNWTGLQGTFTGVTVTDLQDFLRHPYGNGFSTYPWKGIPSGGRFESFVRELGFLVVQSDQRKGGGYLTIICEKPTK